MLKRSIVKLFAVAAFLCASATAASAQWKALAVNNHGWAYAEGWSEEHARANAVYLCRLGTKNRSCQDTVSVEFHWSAVVVRCPNGQLATFASEHSGYYGAAAAAAYKVGFRWCDIIVRR